MSLTKRDSPDEVGGTEIPRPEYDQWSLEAALESFRQDYGDEALAESLDSYMTERGIY